MRSPECSQHCMEIIVHPLSAWWRRTWVADAREPEMASSIAAARRGMTPLERVESSQPAVSASRVTTPHVWMRLNTWDPAAWWISCPLARSNASGTCVTDEHHAPTVLAVHGLGGEATCVSNIVHVLWKPSDTRSPYRYQPQDVTRKTLDRIRARGINCYPKLTIGCAFCVRLKLCIGCLAGLWFRGQAWQSRSNVLLKKQRSLGGTLMLYMLGWGSGCALAAPTSGQSAAASRATVLICLVHVQGRRA